LFHIYYKNKKKTQKKTQNTRAYNKLTRTHIHTGTFTPAYIAAEKGQKEVVSYLLQIGVDPTSDSISKPMNVNCNEEIKKMIMEAANQWPTSTLCLFVLFLFLKCFFSFFFFRNKMNVNCNEGIKR
jgi:hypothetical protein